MPDSVDTESSLSMAVDAEDEIFCTCGVPGIEQYHLVVLRYA